MAAGKGSARGVRAGRAYIEIFADSNALNRGLRNVQQRLNRFSATVAGAGLRLSAVGAAILAPLAAATKSFANVGDSLDKMSARTGASTKFLSELSFAAERSGGSIEDVERSMRMLSRNMYRSLIGSKQAAEAFRLLGMDAAKLAAMSPEDQFSEVAESLSRIENPAMRSALAMELFGRAGTAILPMIGGLKDLRREAESIGVSWSEEQSKAAAELTDEFSNMRASAGGVFREIGFALAPSLIDLSRRATQVIKTIADFVKENKGLVVSVAKIGVTLSGAGLALLGVAGALKIAAFGFGALAVAVKLIFSPIALAIGTVAALGTMIAIKTEEGSKAVAGLGRAFGHLPNRAKETVSAMAAAFAKGDISSAIKVLWASIRLSFQEGAIKIREIWSDLKEFAISTWGAAVIAIVNLSSRIAEGIDWALQKGRDYLEDFRRGAVGVFEEVTDYFGNTLARNQIVEQARVEGGDEAARREGEAFDRMLEKQKERSANARRMEQDEQRRARAAKQEESRAIYAAQREANIRQQMSKYAAAATDERRRDNDAIEEAKGKLNGLRGEYEAARKEAEKPVEIEIPEPDVKKIGGIGLEVGINSEDLDDLRDFTNRIRDDVVGTFSSLRVGSLSIAPSSAEERTANAVEKLLGINQKIRIAVENAGIQFAE